MMKIIHLTDTHIVEGDQHLYGIKPRPRLAKAIDSINAEHADAAFVIHTGDMTEWGDPAAFKTLADEMARLTMPVHFIMGNHDDIGAFADTFSTVELDTNGFAQSSVETPVGRFLLLDTHIPRQSAGGYCEKRRQWLSEVLNASDAPVFLCMHHPPLPIGIFGMDQYSLQDADAFYEVLAPHKDRIRHIFFGHVHRVIFGTWRGIPYSCMRGTNHQVALDLKDENPLILGNLEPPAYGVVLIDQDNVTVHVHDFADTSPHFDLDTEDGGYRRHSLGMRHDGYTDIA